MEETKKENKKKNARPRPETASDTENSGIAQAVASLDNRFAALAFEITALRADLGASKAGKKRAVRNLVAPVTTSEDGSTHVSPDLLLTTLHADARQVQHESGDAVAILLTAFAQSPDIHSEDTSEPVSAVAQTTVLRLVPNAARNSQRDGREAVLCERAARIAASLGATPRILIARLLLTDGTLTATQLGTGANLTTGSLYHHLREMTHAGVLAVVSRNRYDLTPLGRRSLLSLLVSIISATLLLVCATFPDYIVRLAGEKYLSMRDELLWAMSGACVHLLSATAWMLNAARRWTYWWYLTLSLLAFAQDAP